MVVILSQLRFSFTWYREHENVAVNIDQSTILDKIFGRKERNQEISKQRNKQG